MLVTKHAAELCALLVDDVHGELPSRVLLALLTKGRLNVAQLGQHTALGLRHVRNGLGVLIQQNLIYHHTDPDSRVTSYEANPDACYSLVRAGKILQVIEAQYGPAERDIVQALMLFGHARIADLVHACESRNRGANGQTNGVHTSNGLAHSESGLYTVLARLVQAEIVETMRPDSFRNPTDVYNEIAADVTRTAPGEKASTKNKADQIAVINDRTRNFRDQSRSLKHHLDRTRGPYNTKRRKLQNGNHSNGHSEFDQTPDLDPNLIVRVNHEKCLVELRNERLTAFAKDVFGEVTGEIYRALLVLLTAKVAHCRPDQLLGGSAPTAPISVTTFEIFDHIGEDLDVFRGIGKASRDKIDSDLAEKIRPQPPGTGDESDDDDDEPPVRAAATRVTDSDDEESDDTDEGPPQRNSTASATNGDGRPKVKFEDDKTSKDGRLNQTRQHLLLLSNSSHGFVRQCGSVARGQWIVDYPQLIARIRESELDAFIAESFGRHGLRLTKVLREKGKIDEKALTIVALMKKADVQSKMLAMQMAGLVDVQEVPKDNSRLANRTLFFWYFDAERTESQLLDDLYKAMLRCLQTLQVERRRKRVLLDFVGRVDVQGKEEEVMTTEHYNEYNRHQEVQSKLLGQLMRLDDVVATFRDF